MRMKQTNTNNRKTMSFFKDFWIRLCVAVFVFAMQGGAVYAGWLVPTNGTSAVKYSSAVLTVDEKTACSGSPIVLSSKGILKDGYTNVFVYRSSDGHNFTEIGNASGANGVYAYVDDMKETDFYYFMKVFSNSNRDTVIFTDTVAVIQAPKEDCAAKCHTTTTGEYYLGTDFNPEENCGESFNFNLDCVENHFEENGITFEGKTAGKVEKWDNVTSVDSAAGVIGKNYYYVFNPNGTDVPFELSFDMDRYNYKTYRFTMRMYVDLSGCNYSSIDDNMKMNFRSSFGDDYNSAVEAFFYNGRTGEYIDRNFVESNGQVPNNNIGAYLKKAYNAGAKIVRIDFTFFGMLKDRNWNTDLKIWPHFQQWPSCTKVAVDYISGEAQMVCMDNSAACMGDKVLVRAAGFPYGAKYVWEHKNGNGWDVFNDENVEQLSITVKKLGRDTFRVRDANSNDPNNATVVVFAVTGKNCQPKFPSDLVGEKEFCFSGDDKMKFFVDPREGGANVFYTWKLYNPKGDSINDRVQVSKSSQIVVKDEVNNKVYTEYKGDTAYVSLKPSNGDVTGKYTLMVLTNYYEHSLTGVVNKKSYEDTLKVDLYAYRTPVVTLELSKGGPEICPTDKKQLVLAKATAVPSDGEYVFDWSLGANGFGVTDSAKVVLPSDACTNPVDEHIVGVTARRKGTPASLDGCPMYVEKTFTVSPVVPPTISCATLTNNKTYELKATSKDTSLLLQTPVIEVGCEDDPEFVVTIKKGSGSGVCDVLWKEIVTTKLKWEKELKNVPVSFEHGDYCVEYVVRDGCGNEAACSVQLSVKDVSGPNIACHQIRSYTTKLSEQEGCVATPNRHDSLPKLIEFPMQDLNGIDGEVTGEYMGRWLTANAPEVLDSATIAKFSKENDLNDPYVVGTTYILWGFKDNWGNYTYCTQKITVIDDLKPRVVCPDVPDDFVVASFEDTCGLSVNGLLRQVEAPVAYDTCSGQGVQLKAKVYMSEASSDSWTEFMYVDSTQYDSIIFNINQEYRIVWRYFKSTNAEVYEDCEIQFSVADQTAPFFDCRSLTTVLVLANNYKEKDKSPVYREYASYNDNAPYEATLKDPFDEGLIKFVTADQLYDNCDKDNIVVEIRVFDPSGTVIADNVGETSTQLSSLGDLKQLQYKVGTNQIQYIFKDVSGNESSCYQKIVVNTGTTPEPDCPEEYVTLRVDDKCEAEFLLKKEDVPTALDPVIPLGRYFVFPSDVIKKANDIYRYFPVSDGNPEHEKDRLSELADFIPHYLEAGYVHPEKDLSHYIKYNEKLNIGLLCQINTYEYWDLFYHGQAYEPSEGSFDKIAGLYQWDSWSTRYSGAMLGESESMTKTAKYTIYPYMIELLDMDGNPVLDDNGDEIIRTDSVYGAVDGSFDPANDEIVPLRYYRPRAFHPLDVNGNTEKTNKYDHVCEGRSINSINNYADEVIKVKLRKGEYHLIYHFENTRKARGAADYQSVPCTVKIIVEDTIPPTIDCDVIQNTVTKTTYAANEKCELPMSELFANGFKVFSKEDLSVSDNCTPSDDVKLFVERIQDASIYRDSTTIYTQALPMGKTTFLWIVEDDASIDKPNRDTCSLTIIVEDKTPPGVNCDNYEEKTFPVEEGSCEISGEKVGLLPRKADEGDLCSNESEEIFGVPLRYRELDGDGNPIWENKDPYTDPYELGYTYVRWTFTDKSGNDTFCVLPINVVDNQAPSFNCQEISNIDHPLESGQCTMSKEDLLTLLGTHKAKDNCGEEYEGKPYLHVAEGDVMKPQYEKFDFSIFVELPTEFKNDTTYKIVWVFEDGVGNASACYQDVILRDVTKPDISEKCPANGKEITVEAGESCSVGFDNFGLPTIEEMMINDKCDGDIYPELWVYYCKWIEEKGAVYDSVVKIKGGKDGISGMLFDVTKDGYPHYVRYIYEDKVGNRDTCMYLVNVVDTVAPVVICQDQSSIPLFPADGKCFATWNELDPVFTRPSAEDACDAVLLEPSLIEPTLNRYFVSCSEYEDGVCVSYDTTFVSNSEKDSVYRVGLTLLEYVFTDKRGNSDTCVISVTVDTDIQCPNDTIRPKTELGKCEVLFESVNKILNDKKSYAVDICTGDSVLGEWTGKNGTFLPSNEFKFEIGQTYEGIVELKIPLVSGDKFCPVVIIPSHQNSLVPACVIDSLSDFVVTAKEGECEAEAGAAASIPVPTATDPCTNDVVNGVPFIFEEVDGKVDTIPVDFSTKVFPTGTTTIYWQFVSPYNLTDTAWCEQDVLVKGNKKFDLDCETLTPMRRDTIDDCGVTDPTEFVIDTPMVNDPCVKDENGNPVLIPGVPVRSDNITGLSTGFSIGETKIMWIFTDVTGAIHDTCFQTIEVRTSLDMIIECDSIKDVEVPVDTGQCTVDASQVNLPTPYALHPCKLDENGDSLKIWGVPTRSDGNPLDAPYYVGKTTITWTFTDTTETLVNEVRTCTSNVFVGDVNEVPVECKNFPDTVVVLPEDKCELSWTNFNFEVKPVVDLCTREIIDPVVTIKSTGEKIDYKTFFVLEDGSEVEELTELQSAKDTVVRLLSEGISFGLGADTIVWEYDFKGSVFTCEQRISVKNKVAPSGGCENVPDELTFQAPTGVCEMSSSMVMDSLLAALNPWPVAYDHCDTNKENPINGKVYYNGQEITSTSKFDMPVGKNIVTWVFIDTAINIVGDTCEKTIIIQSDLAPVFDCESLDTLNFETDDCVYTYVWDEKNTPKAVDACTGDSILGTGTRSDGEALNAPYPVGETVITWKFVSPYSTAVHSCPQSVWVRTTAQPLFECESLDTIKLTTPEGVCEVDAFVYLNKMTKPVAEDSCTGIKIEGVPLTKDSVAFVETDSFVVGDTTKIIWKFFNDSLNVNAKYCDQYVLVTGSNAPIFNCDTLQGRETKFEIAGCDTILGPNAIPTPVALDFCTKDSIWGVGERSDGETDLFAPFKVGTTVITWIFNSPYSNVADSCTQDVVVLSTQEIDFECKSLDSIIVPIDDIEICDVENIEIKGVFANHPCPEQSGVTKIVGVPFINKNTDITPNSDSTIWVVKKVHVGAHKITWTFTDPSDPATLVQPVKVCTQILQIGVGTNASVDCENFPDTTFKLSPDDCVISWEEMDLNIAPVKDLCMDTLLIPVVYRTSGKAISAVLSADSTEMIITADDFTVGVDTIVWEFESIGAECEQVIIVKDSTAPLFDCENFEPSHLALTAPSGECEEVASAIYDTLAAMLQPWPFAVEYCTQEEIPGRVYIDDANIPENEIKKGSALDVTVGDHKLIWVFVDTLINEVGDTCVKDFTLKSDIAPKFECSDLTDISFDIEGCNTTELTDADIPTPVATDACVAEQKVPAVGVRLNADSTVQVDANGDTLSVLGVYPVGTTIIRWSFVSPFSNVEKVCYQNVVVKTSRELEYDCDVLANKNLRIPLDPRTELTNPDAATSKLDTLHANHPCPQESGVEYVLGVPSIDGQADFILSEDSLKWTIPALPADTYTIIWTFRDTSGTLIEPVKICTQSLIVEDVIDTLTCPPGRNLTTIACETELPEIIKTFDEFIGAGGSITDHNAFDKNSFGYKEFSSGDKYCDETRRIMYYVLDIRKDTVACTDTFFIRDTIAPTFVSNLDALTITCDQDVPELLKPTVDDCDPNVTITSEKSSTQGDDPNKCDYYSYVVTYKWTATDRCGNVTDTTQMIQVVDTIAPKVTLPENWTDTVLSIYEKGCVFLVPNFTEDLRDENVIRDNCTPIGSVIITQSPQGGDTIYKTTKVEITISDPCGKDTVVEKWVYAPERSSVIELTSVDTVSCVSDDVPFSLMDLDLRYAIGTYLVFDDWTGEYFEKSSTFQWDIYRNKVDKDSLVFSNNKHTYADLFKGYEDKSKLYELTRQKHSATYWFVAADTMTMCTDTSASVVTLRERPRVSVTTGVEEVCENTIMDSATIYGYFDCVADMGAPITKQGWMYGDSIYNFSDGKFALVENSMSFIYYAENECGASTSMDSYKFFCGMDSTTLTKEDSIFFVGAENYEALKNDKYVDEGHVVINVHQRFDPAGITITTEPHDPSRIWLGEYVELQAHTNSKFTELVWYRVVGEYDRRNVVAGEDQFEFEFNDPEDEEDIKLGEMSYKDSWIITDAPEDTARYYVTISDLVCPSVSSALTQVNVILKIPTAFTPYERDGYNDVFMERHSLTIFDRYGQKVFSGDNGWDGTKGGKLADPGVYFYTVTMTDGSQRKGTIEVVYLKD